jgi:hypothetical protein
MSFAIFSLPTTDMILSPQQMGNVLQQVLGSSTLQRTKLLLDEFADEKPGNDVLLVQDQIGTSCVIALQTWIQKQCFVEWGDALVMDWTHGTNNLGYCSCCLRHRPAGTALVRVPPGGLSTDQLLAHPMCYSASTATPIETQGILIHFVLLRWTANSVLSFCSTANSTRSASPDCQLS